MRRGLNTQETLAPLEQLDSNISGDDSSDEDFSVDNVNSSSESSDSDSVEHYANMIPLVIPKIGRPCGHARRQGRKNNVPNLCYGCNNNKCSSSSGITSTPINFSCPTSTAVLTPVSNIVTIIS